MSYAFYPPNVSNGATGNLNGVAGEVSVTNGQQSVSGTYSSPFTNTSYALTWSMQNTTDSSPIFLEGYISAKSTSGFTVTFNAPADTGNYILNYVAVVNV